MSSSPPAAQHGRTNVRGILKTLAATTMIAMWSAAAGAQEKLTYNMGWLAGQQHRGRSRDRAWLVQERWSRGLDDARIRRQQNCQRTRSREVRDRLRRS